MKIQISFTKPFIAALLSLVTLLAIASCGDSESATEEPTATATLSSYELTQEVGQSEYETCYKPTEDLITDIVSHLRHSDVGMRAFYILRNSAFTNSWTVAAELEGPGFEGEGPITLFDAIGIRVERIGIDNIQPFNSIAKEQTTLNSTISESTFESLSIDYKEGLELLDSCIREELNSDPDTTVYRAD